MGYGVPTVTCGSGLMFDCGMTYHLVWRYPVYDVYKFSLHNFSWSGNHVLGTKRLPVSASSSATSLALLWAYFQKPSPIKSMLVSAFK
jgi:hypothetical protein